MREWLDLVPASKIFGFGGDYCFVEGVPAHVAMARENIAMVLTKKVVEGYFSEDEALQIARMLLRDNPARVFGLELR